MAKVSTNVPRLTAAELGSDRPPEFRIVHFSCNGRASIKLATINGNFVRVGDTASGEADDGSLVLLRCDEIVKPHGIVWGIDCPWTETQAAARIYNADLLVVIE